MTYELRGLEFGYARSAPLILRGLDATLAPGQLTAIAGPNGAGKSTLLRLLAGLLHPTAGYCRYGGKDVRAWRRRDFAREVSLLPQTVSLDFPFTAEQLVMMGRDPHFDGWFANEADQRAARRAMELTDCADYRCRDYRFLSGGERQRVLLAAALAAEPRVLLLDEPSTFLDLRHQMDLYGLLRQLARDGLLVVTVTHDLNLAAHYADRALLLHEGRLFADGSPSAVFGQANLETVFRVSAALPPVVRYEA